MKNEDTHYTKIVRKFAGRMTSEREGVEADLRAYPPQELAALEAAARAMKEDALVALCAEIAAPWRGSLHFTRTVESLAGQMIDARTNVEKYLRTMQADELSAVEVTARTMGKDALASLCAEIAGSQR